MYTPGQSYDGKQNKHNILESSASEWEEFFLDLIQLSHVRTFTSFPPTCMLWDEKKTDSFETRVIKTPGKHFSLGWKFLYVIVPNRNYKRLTRFSLNKTSGIRWCDQVLT